MWKNSVERGRSQMTKWRIQISCRISKATNIQLEYVILIALPLQQWLHERFSIFRYTFIASLIYIAKEKLSKYTLEALEENSELIYLSTAIGLTPGGSSTVHIYTQTIHRTIKIT
jgi:hypothetical protein